MTASSDVARRARSPPGEYLRSYYPQANLKVETKVETETHGGRKLKMKLMVVNGGIGDGMVTVTESKRGARGSYGKVGRGTMERQMSLVGDNVGGRRREPYRLNTWRA